MSHLYRAFSVSYTRFLRWLYRAFPESEELFDELTNVVQLAQSEPETHKFGDEWAEYVRPNEEAVYASDPAVFEKVPMFRRIKMADLYVRMAEPERKAFWANVVSLCQNSRMLAACGAHLGTMEEVALEFVQSNRGLKAEEYHQKVFEQMLSGGDFSTKLIETFKKPGALRSIVENFSGMMRAPGQEPIDMSGLLRMMEETDLSNLDKEFAEMQEQIKGSGMNPFEDIKTAMSEAAAAAKPVAPTDDPLQATIASTSAMADAVKRMTAKILAQKEKEDAEKKKPATASVEDLE